MDDSGSAGLGRRAFLTGSAGLAAGVAVVQGVALAPPAAAHPPRPTTSYPVVREGTWTRGANLRDRSGRFQARQEHASVVLNNFVYLIGGFVPVQPPPAPTENDPEPFPFAGTGEVLVYTPRGQAAAGPARPGEWVSLPEQSSFPHESMHHINAVAHRGEIWAFGGHAGPFEPTPRTYVFTPRSATDPSGTWRQVDAPLPQPRSAGAAVSVGNRIYLLGGVVPYANSPDPVNQSIRTTSSVLYLDTTQTPLRWRETAPMLDRREHFNAVFAEGRIWVFQGRNESDTRMRRVESLAVGATRARWRREQDAPVGASANVLGLLGRRVYSFGGEFIASNITGTLIASQFFDLGTRRWSRLRTVVQTAPLDASGADSKHGTYGAVIREEGRLKLLAPGGAATAWFDPMSKVHVFTP